MNKLNKEFDSAYSDGDEKMIEIPLIKISWR